MGATGRNRPALRFIPFRKRDIVEMCIVSGGLTGTQQLQFREVCGLIQSVFHFEFHANLEALKDAYAPLNPDRDTRKVGVFAQQGEVSFVDQMENLLDAANYERLTDEDLQRAFNEASLFRLRLHVNFDDFDEVLLFVRGEGTKTEQVRKFFGIYQKEVQFSNFDRVVIYIKFSESSQARGLVGRPGKTMLKLFQNVPRADIEMLFPNTEVGMRLIDKLIIGVPAILGGGIVLTTKLGTSLLLLGALFGFWLGLHSQPVELDEAALIGLFAGIGALGSFIWRQFVNFKNRKLIFLQALTQDLYFKNLDNNAGVFHRLIDDAEEEECKEAILAYYFLFVAGGEATEASLDRSIEAWFLERWGSPIDFEVDDAIQKLKKLGLVHEVGGRLLVLGLEETCKTLDRRWDEYFSFAPPRAGAGLD